MRERKCLCSSVGRDLWRRAGRGGQEVRNVRQWRFARQKERKGEREREKKRIRLHVEHIGHEQTEIKSQTVQKR